MQEYNVKRSVKIVIAAILLVCLIPVIGMENMIDMPLIFLLVFTVGFGAAASGHLVSLLVYLFTGKDLRRLIKPVCSGLLLLGSLLWALHESHHFMGKLGAGIIEALFSVPFGTVFLFQLICSVVHAVKSRRNRQNPPV